MARRRNDDGLIANEIHVLAVLIDTAEAGGSRHLGDVRLYGYPVFCELNRRRRAAGERAVSDATVYRCLRRLEERGLLVSEWESDAEAAADKREGRKRRYYRLDRSAPGELAAAHRQLDQLDGRPRWYRAQVAG